MHKRALKSVARLAHIDLLSALKTTRISPLLESEINIDEELINLKESIESYYTAGDTLREYPHVYEHMSKEKREILKHCFGLVVRMMMGKRLPLPYDRRHAGKRMDDEMVEIFRPYLTMRQRIALRDFRVDMVMTSDYMHRAQMVVGRLPMLRAK
jgi:hypothetical protein